MESISKGLHGLNKKIPQVVLKRDFLAFSLQLFSLFVCVVTAILWPILGFDSSLDQLLAMLSGKTFLQAGAGTHLSTILNFFAITFLISIYLSSKEIDGFHNILVSLLVPATAMMIFEFPWFILTDLFHNSAVEGYWAITLFGLGNVDVGVLAIALFLIPTSTFYFAFTWANGHLAMKSVIPFSAFVSFGVGAFILIFSLWFGTLTVLLRNTFALFFLAFAHASLMDATKNPTMPELIKKYDLKQRIKAPAIMILAAVGVFLVWIWWPYFTAVKGNMWPQTVYGFYIDGKLDRLVWVPNNAIHAFNVLSKALVTAGASLAIIPKILVKK